MNDLLDTVEIETASPVGAGVIWLHGLGADGHDFEPIVPALGLERRGVRFVFPHAPIRPVTVNGGFRMRAWYDVLGLDLGSKQDETGILESAEHVRRLIAREIERGTAAERLVLAGFSQGGALALHTALRYPDRLAGVIALSTYLPLHDRFDAEAVPAHRDMAIFMAHGTMDPLVPVGLGETSRDFLEQRGYAPSWKTYPMQHAVCPEEVADLGAWLRDRLPD